MKKVSASERESLQEQVRSILGKRYIRQKIDSPFDYISIANKGVSSHIITNFRQHFDLGRETTSDLLNVSEPTIYRWIKQNKELPSHYAIQLFELTELFHFGIHVFDDRANFFKWLELPNTALGGIEPMKLLKYPGGISKVRDVLGRIEYGVFS